MDFIKVKNVVKIRITADGSKSNIEIGIKPFARKTQLLCKQHGKASVVFICYINTKKKQEIPVGLRQGYLIFCCPKDGGKRRPAQSVL
jgi:hypothetical protein